MDDVINESSVDKNTRTSVISSNSMQSGISTGLQQTVKFVLNPGDKGKSAKKIKVEQSYRSRIENFLVNPRSSLAAKVNMYILVL